MKKILCSCMIFILLFNFIINSVCYAAGQSDDQYSSFVKDNKNAKVSKDGVTDIMDKGETSQKQGSRKKVSTSDSSYGVSIVGVILGYVALIIDLIPLTISFFISTFTRITDGDDSDIFFFSIERAVFNRIPLFYVNSFNDEETYTVGEKEYVIPDANKSIRESVSKFYVFCRLLAIAISLLVLIYIGIRMVLSTVASQQARYKKMFIGWLESLIILFILPYIMIFIFEFGEMLTEMFYNLRTSTYGSKESFEEFIGNELINGILDNSGLKMAVYSLIYWILTFSQIKFFYIYLKRVLLVGFLIMIAPLITVTYPIDKAGDGKAQAFGAWMNEFCMNVLIQPLHALIYLIFMLSAGEIAKFAPILGVAFMLSLGTVEKMVKKIFNFKDAVSVGGINQLIEQIKARKG